MYREYSEETRSQVQIQRIIIQVHKIISFGIMCSKMSKNVFKVAKKRCQNCFIQCPSIVFIISFDHVLEVCRDVFLLEVQAFATFWKEIVCFKVCFQVLAVWLRVCEERVCFQLQLMTESAFTINGSEENGDGVYGSFCLQLPVRVCF